MNVEEMKNAGIDPSLIAMSQKGFETVNGRVDTKTEVLNESGEVIEEVNNEEITETVETTETTETVEDNINTIDENNDVSDEEAESGAEIDNNEKKETEETEENKEIDENSYSLEKLYRNMEENSGKLGDELKLDLESRFEKAGIPKELVDRFEKLEKMNANNEVKGMLSAFGSKEERTELFSWAKAERANDPVLNMIVNDYNEAAKSRNIDKAKETANILLGYRNKSNENIENNTEQKKITLVGNKEKANVVKKHYNNNDELKSDLRKVVKKDKSVDFNDIVNKVIASKLKNK